MSGQTSSVIAKVAKSARGSKPGERRGGRKAGTPNKCTSDLKELAREYTADALQTLVSVMAGGEGIPAAAQVSAANAILDRGYGKPSQTIDAGENIVGALAEIIAARRSKVAKLNGE